MSRIETRTEKGGRYNAIMQSYNWSLQEEERAIALHRQCNSIVKVARKMRIPYRSVNVMLQRRGIIPTKAQDIRLVSELCKLYPAAEVCERLNMTNQMLVNFAKEHGIKVYKTQGDMPRASAMPFGVCHRVFATLANAVAQAQQEKFAIIEAHLYNRGAIIRGEEGCYVEFHVINERHERFCTGHNLELSINDIYIKTPKEAKFIVDQDTIEKYSNVINNNTTVIINNNHGRE